MGAFLSWPLETGRNHTAMFWGVSGHDFQSCRTTRYQTSGFSPCKNSPRAKALLKVRRFAARLKMCPDTNLTT